MKTKQPKPRNSQEEEKYALRWLDRQAEKYQLIPEEERTDPESLPLFPAAQNDAPNLFEA